jgi:hypothetical protein
MSQRIIAAFFPVLLVSCRADEPPRITPASRLAVLEQEVRTLLEEHSRLESLFLEGATSKDVSGLRGALDHELAEVGGQIVTVLAKTQTEPECDDIVDETVGQLGSLPVAELWRRFVELERRGVAANGRLDQHQPTGACTSSWELMEVFHINASLHRVRNALKSAYGVSVAHAR